jgi:3-hydroxyisobutyrate dehydrogenase
MTSTPATNTIRGTAAFLGLGVMGAPMALNLARAGVDLVVWNRTAARAEPLQQAGARIADSVDDAFRRAPIVFVMFVNEDVTDEVLGRGTRPFADRVAGHLVVSMGSTSPEYSRGLAADIEAAGGRYVEAPVSGSRGPAEAGTLLALLGGAAEDIDRVLPLLEPMTRGAIVCGPVGNGLVMKLTVNHYLNVMLAALAEAVHFADNHGLDRALVERAIMLGPMASEVAGAKLIQLVNRDFDVRAATQDALASTQLIAASARTQGVSTPLLDLSSELLREAIELGHARSDMIAIIEAMEARSSR